MSKGSGNEVLRKTDRSGAIDVPAYRTCGTCGTHVPQVGTCNHNEREPGAKWTGIKLPPPPCDNGKDHEWEVLYRCRGCGFLVKELP